MILKIFYDILLCYFNYVPIFSRNNNRAKLYFIFEM